MRLDDKDQLRKKALELAKDKRKLRETAHRLSPSLAPSCRKELFEKSSPELEDGTGNPVSPISNKDSPPTVTAVKRTSNNVNYFISRISIYILKINKKKNFI